MLGAPQPVPIGTDGHIPPSSSEQANSFVCECVTAAIRVTQERDRLAADRSNLRTAIRMRLDDLRVDGRPLPAEDFASVASRLAEMVRVEKIQAVCREEEIDLWLSAVPLADWLESLSRTGPGAEPVLIISQAFPPRIGET